MNAVPSPPPAALPHSSCESAHKGNLANFYQTGSAACVHGLEAVSNSRSRIVGVYSWSFGGCTSVLFTSDTGGESFPTCLAIYVLVDFSRRSDALLSCCPKYVVASLTVPFVKMNTTYPPRFNPAHACTLDTCSIWQSEYLHYRPSLFGNVLFLGILSITAVGQLCLGMRYKTGLVCIPMLLGLGCEVLGYVARVLLPGDPFVNNFFMLYLMCLILGPAFMAAAMYLCFGRIMVAYGEEISRLRGITFILLFMGGDVFNLVVQVSCFQSDNASTVLELSAATCLVGYSGLTSIAQLWRSYQSRAELQLIRVLVYGR